MKNAKRQNAERQNVEQQNVEQQNVETQHRKKNVAALTCRDRNVSEAQLRSKTHFCRAKKCLEVFSVGRKMSQNGK
jgi:hypothetical protein